MAKNKVEVRIDDHAGKWRVDYLDDDQNLCTDYFTEEAEARDLFNTCRPPVSLLRVQEDGRAGIVAHRSESETWDPLAEKRGADRPMTIEDVAATAGQAIVDLDAECSKQRDRVWNVAQERIRHTRNEVVDMLNREVARLTEQIKGLSVQASANTKDAEAFHQSTRVLVQEVLDQVNEAKTLAEQGDEKLEERITGLLSVMQDQLDRLDPAVQT